MTVGMPRHRGPIDAGGRWNRTRVLTLLLILLVVFVVSYGLGRVLGPIEHPHRHPSHQGSAVVVRPTGT